jgi:flagellar biosynthesis protein FlhB
MDISINPTMGILPTTNPGTIITNAITIAYIVAVLLVLFFIIKGAFMWITSNGDKEAVSHARKTITAALVGLTILALAFVILRVVGYILNINIIGNVINIPALDGRIVL